MGLKNVLNTVTKSDSKVLENRRAEAVSEFERMGFPTKKNEEWRFTNVAPIVNTDFTVKKDGVKKNLIEILAEYKFDANVVVIYNGNYSSELSKITEESGKVFIGSFAEAYSKGFDKAFDEHFGKYASDKVDGFTALNTSMINSGLFVYVSKGASLKKPVMVINFIEDSDTEIFANHRNLIVVEEDGNAEVSEVYYANGKRASFSNVVTEVFIGENAELHHNKVQNEGDNAYHVGTTQVEQKNHSRLYSSTISWGGSLLRNNLNSVINGEGIDCYFRGFYLTKGEQIIDNHTLADHAMPNSHSNEFYKGILDDKGTGIFNGKIMVRQDAQKTNAYQTNKNVLLTNEATINSKPQLEIFADDVKCSHGATTGQINPDEIFYLRARGISEHEAKKLLLSAYAHEIIDEVKNEELRNLLVKTLEKKLG
ncbi:MAG: Fe-S cluster assembly protein SufD [Ignavibacteriota bacterium]